MLKIKNILVFPLLLAAVSCNLDVIPQDSISPDTFFSTESELQLYTNQFYAMEPDAEDIYGETSNLIVNGNTLSAIYQGLTRQVPADGGGWNWGTLRHINYFLQNTYRCSDEAVRTRYESLAYFWRAWFYFNMLCRYGDVPWYDQPLQSTDDELLTKPRDRRDVIVGHIIEDLDKAIEHLPDEVSIYTVNKYTAMALKSRACLFEGTFRKYHAGTTFNKEVLPYEDLLKECANVSIELIKSNKYSLYTEGDTPYLNLFNAQSLNPREVIFARRYGGNFKHMVDAYAMVSTKGCCGLTKALTASYLMTDGSRFTDIPGWETMQLEEEIQNRDPRFAQTVLTRAGQYPDETAATFSKDNTGTGYPLIKYISGSSYVSASTVDMPVYRIAEIYLNYAEAKAELGTLTQSDLDLSLNLLRDRVGMPHLQMTAANAAPDPFLTSETFGYQNVPSGQNKGVILEIRRERGIELVGEGLRVMDLFRWREGKIFEQPIYGPYIPGPGIYDMDGDGTADFVVNSDTDTYSAPGVVPVVLNKSIFLSDGDKGFIWAHKDVLRAFNEERDYLYPLPSNDITLARGNLVQNPGW